MLYIPVLSVYLYLLWIMFSLPSRSYIKAMCAFFEAEQEQMDYFNRYKGNNTEIDIRYDSLLSNIKDPVSFFIKQMFFPFCYYVLFSIFYLWVFFRLGVLTFDGVRIIGSLILVFYLFILSIHIGFIEQYKKQANKIIEENVYKKEMEAQAFLMNLLQRTSTNYDTPEAE